MKQLCRRNFVGQFASAGTVFVLAGGSQKVIRAQAAPPVESKSGIVVAVDGNRIFLNNGAGGLTLKMKSSVRIWKGEDGVPISAIRPGDDLAMRGVMDTDGTFVPAEIWVNIVAIDGLLKAINGALITIDVVRNEKRLCSTDENSKTDR